MSNQRRKPNFQKIAEAAGVSPSTVDRVLNERGSVSDAKRRQVIEAARGLGVSRILPSPSHGLLHFDVVLAHSSTDHLRRLQKAIINYAQLVGPRIAVHRTYWSEKQHEQMIAYLSHPPRRRHGLMIVVNDSPDVRYVLGQVIGSGTPTVLLTSNVQDLDGHIYVGVDNYAAGRTAGYLLSRFARIGGPVALLTSSLRYLAHRERIQGFFDALKGAELPFQVLGPLECMDDPSHTRHHIEQISATHPHLVGLYNTGAGSAGIREALLKLPSEKRPVWITHESTPEHADLLKERLLSLVIDQDPEMQAIVGLQHLLYSCGELSTAPSMRPNFALATPENVRLAVI